MPKTSDLDTDTFDSILGSILDEQTGVSLLAIPGLYEVVAEHFNNEVIERHENPRPAMICEHCGSTDVDVTAWVSPNAGNRITSDDPPLEGGFCNACEREITASHFAGDDE